MLRPRTRYLAWRACIAGVMLLLGMTYSPLVMRAGVTVPWLLGLPLTLWTSLLTACGIVVLTAIGAAVLPDEESTRDRTEPETNHQ